MWNADMLHKYLHPLKIIQNTSILLFLSSTVLLRITKYSNVRNTESFIKAAIFLPLPVLTVQKITKEK